jgi:hypothetical protein
MFKSNHSTYQLALLFQQECLHLWNKQEYNQVQLKVYEVSGIYGIITENSEENTSEAYSIQLHAQQFSCIMLRYVSCWNFSI